MNIFSYNGKLMNFLTTFWDIVWISILWILFSIPIITFGAASTAAYYAMSKSVRRNIGHVTAEFFGAFKSNLKQATIATAVYIIIGIVLAADGYYFLYNQTEYALAGRLFTCLLILLYLVAMTYAFPLLSRFQVKSNLLIRYSLSMTISNPGRTLSLIVFWLGALFLTYKAWWAVLLIPGFKCFLDCLMLDPYLKQLEEESKDL